MPSFLERHSDNIAGVLSCFDRVIIQGTLPDICHPKASTDWWFAHKIRIFDYKPWAAPMNDQIRNNIEKIAAEAWLEIEFVRKQRDFRKEQRVKEIIATRGDHPGIVHIFSAMESCTAFKPWHDKQTHANYFKYDTGRCLHYYVYFIDKEFGLCYLRIPTWAPFRLQFYFNGHNWLARQLDKRGIGYQQVENAFVQVDDFAKAQKLADHFPVKRLHRLLDRYAKKLCPPVAKFHDGIHWSIMQVEYATDIIFADRKTLSPIYEELIRTLSHSVKPDNVSMFLGKRLHGLYEGELGTQLSTRQEGRCLRHYMGKSGIKMYDKFGSVLRIESFTNDVSFFKHHRRVEHRDGTYSYQTANMRKTIYSLSALSELMHACNRRYLDFLSAVDDPTNGIKKVNKVSRSVKDAGRSYRGFNLFSPEDEAVFRAIAQGGVQGFGIRNSGLRAALGKTSGQVSRILKRLRNHGLIKKVANVYKYHLTSLGREVVTTSLKLKEMFVIPVLRGEMRFA
jgi:DNA-binding MarR family transcriptional regulator